jgi:uncharacterized C2H2 Zn-finger protein
MVTIHPTPNISVSTQNISTSNISPLQCDKCSKVFVSSSSKCRHIKTCKTERETEASTIQPQIVTNVVQSTINSVQQRLKQPTQYVYLLQERASIQLNENVYKVGRTSQNNLKRVSQYPKGSVLLLQITCCNCIATENEITSLFKNKYVQMKDYGVEYFKGNYISMIDDIYNVVRKTVNIIATDLNHCHNCNMQFKKPWMLTRHLKICSSVPEKVTDADNSHSYKCDKCSTIFQRKFNLTRHTKTCKGIGIDPLICQYCNKSFKHPPAKYHHVKTCKIKAGLDSTSCIVQDN